MLGRAGADDLGEARDADAHQLAARALLGLLVPQLGVADRVHGLVQGARVVAAVVLPAERRLVRELLRLDEVLHAELGGIHAELVGHDVGHALDRVHGLGHAERAAIGDAARRLVGVDAVDLDVRGLQIVGAGADVEEPGGKLRGVRGRVGVAVVGEGLDAQRGERAVLLGGQFGGDVVVARERVGLQILHAVLDPLDRLAGEHRGGDRDHVARVDRHLAAEAAADVRGDDPDLVLGQARRGRPPARTPCGSRAAPGWSSRPSACP